MPGDELFGPTVSTPALIAATSDQAWLQALLDGEAALVGALADVGVAPQRAAEEIAAVCDAARFDARQLGRDARDGGNPAIPLVRALRRLVSDEAALWVHFGATSQDIMDTATMLVAARTLTVIGDSMGSVAEACAVQAQNHRHTIMAGRTLLQPALPTTLGFKTAAWLAGVLDAWAELNGARRDLAVQLGGAVGTLASLGDVGPAVVGRFAYRLGLAAPTISWHTARQRIARLGNALAVAAGTVAKISLDVALLMQDEVGEAREPGRLGVGGSSTLPQKRNPVAAAAVLSAARRSQALAGTLVGSLVAEHERALGAWPTEWPTLSELLVLSGGAVARTAETMTDLEVDVEAMRAHVDHNGGLLLSERVLLHLAPMLGRDPARRAVERAVEIVRRDGVGFESALLGMPEVASRLSPATLKELLDPAGYLGSSDLWIDGVLDRFEHMRPHK